MPTFSMLNVIQSQCFTQFCVLSPVVNGWIIFSFEFKSKKLSGSPNHCTKNKPSHVTDAHFDYRLLLVHTEWKKGCYAYPSFILTQQPSLHLGSLLTGNFRVAQNSVSIYESAGQNLWGKNMIKLACDPQRRTSRFKSCVRASSNSRIHI